MFVRVAGRTELFRGDGLLRETGSPGDRLVRDAVFVEVLVVIERRPNEILETIDLRHLTMNGIALSLGVANVTMQLALLPIGHGVAKSKVESGALRAHPLKRFRTTVAYIVVSLFGTDEEREVMRNEVNRQHRQVRSGPGDDVSYDAFDPELQRWVAACMLRGMVDAVAFFHGSPTEAELDLLYEGASRFATTLQVPLHMWPKDWAEFDRYYEEVSSTIKMDDLTRSFLVGIASLDFLPAPLSRTFGPFHRFMTIGYLPQRFRDELGAEWNERCQRKFDLVVKTFSWVNDLLPKVLREFPMNVILWDTKRRIRRGVPIV